MTFLGNLTCVLLALSHTLTLKPAATLSFTTNSLDSHVGGILALLNRVSPPWTTRQQRPLAFITELSGRCLTAATSGSWWPFQTATVPGWPTCNPQYSSVESLTCLFWNRIARFDIPAILTTDRWFQITNTLGAAVCQHHPHTLAC